MTDINLDRVAGALNARGIAAEVDYTGGNTATLFAGERFFDRDGEPRWMVSAGPGWFEGPGMLDGAVASSEEFAIGDDGDPSGWFFDLDGRTDDVDTLESDVADEIARHVNDFVWPDGAYQRADGHWGERDVLTDERRRAAERVRVARRNGHVMSS